jgi:hypothetical protein
VFGVVDLFAAGVFAGKQPIQVSGVVGRALVPCLLVVLDVPASMFSEACSGIAGGHGKPLCPSILIRPSPWMAGLRQSRTERFAREILAS